MSRRYVLPAAVCAVLVAGAVFQGTASALSPAECFGETATIVGTSGDDPSLNGTAGQDVIVALGGNDTVNGLGGVDLICGGDGNDALNGGPGGDAISGDAGDDQIQGDDGFDLVFFTDSPVPVSVNLAAGTAAGWGNDTILAVEAVRGSRFPDTLSGNGASNYLDGGPSADILDGRGGPDGLDGDAGNDILRGGPGYDVVFFDFAPRAVKINLVHAAGHRLGHGHAEQHRGRGRLEVRGPHHGQREPESAVRRAGQRHDLRPQRRRPAARGRGQGHPDRRRRPRPRERRRGRRLLRRGAEDELLAPL